MAILEIDEWKVRAYAQNVHHMAQQALNKLRGTTREEIKIGERIGFDRLGAMEGETPTSRFAPTPNHQADHSRRWGFPTPWIFARLTDDMDKLQQIHDPMSEYATAGAMAYNREVDRRIIAAIRGTAQEGEQTMAGVVLPAAQKIAHGSTRFTFDKIRAALSLLLTALGGDPSMLGPLTMVYHPDDLQTLLDEPKITSADYVAIKTLMDGRMLDSYMGFQWRMTTLVPTEGTVRYNVAYAKGGVGFVANQGARSESVDRRADLSGAMQVMIKDQFNAVRIEDALVVEIANDLTAAA